MALEASYCHLSMLVSHRNVWSKSARPKDFLLLPIASAAGQGCDCHHNPYLQEDSSSAASPGCVNGQQLTGALVLQPGSKLLFEEHQEDACVSVCLQQLIFTSEG